MKFRIPHPEKGMWWTLLTCVLVPIYLELMRGGGTLTSVYDQASDEMTRFYVVSAVYNFYLYFIQNDTQN